MEGRTWMCQEGLILCLGSSNPPWGAAEGIEALTNPWGVTGFGSEGDFLGGCSCCCFGLLVILSMLWELYFIYSMPTQIFESTSMKKLGVSCPSQPLPVLPALSRFCGLQGTNLGLLLAHRGVVKVGKYLQKWSNSTTKPNPARPTADPCPQVPLPHLS